MSHTSGSDRKNGGAGAPGDATERRGFFGAFASLAMAGGLLAGYGMFASIAGRFLFPARAGARGWMFLTDLKRMKPGDSLIYKSPSGAPVAVARQGNSGSADDFIALSSTCPHLGCQVHWEAQNNRFFCPCHNGSFSPDGTATGGPPAQAGQSLSRYPLKVEKGLLYIEVPLEGLTADKDRSGHGDRAEGHLERPGGPPGPGHDPCLYEKPAGGKV